VSPTFRSLGYRNYRLWFAAALVSNVGAWMQRTAQDWIVLTQLTDDDAVAVGLVMALQFGPLLVIGPFAGTLVDRIPGRRLLVITQSAQAVLALGLGVLTLTGLVQLWMVFAFALALGITTAVDNPARQTFVGELVERKDLPNAVALNSASFNGARLIGPAVAGLSVAAFGSGWVFLLNGLSFAATLVALGLIKSDALQAVARSERGHGGLREGLRYLKTRPDITALLAMVFLVGTFGLNFPIFTSTMARIEFHRGASEFGLLSSVLAIGSLSGALGSARRERPRLRTIVLAAGAFGLACTAAAFLPNYGSFAASLVVIGACSMVMTTSANAYVQTTTPPALRGRVMSVYMALFAGTTLIGAPIVGWVAGTFGPRYGLGVAAFSGLAAAVVGMGWYAASSHARLRWHPEARWPFALEHGVPSSAAAVSAADAGSDVTSAR
jgi:MFS family permease